MATLVLTAVGGAIGGPVGAALGGLLGQAADARVFAPKRRDGPRLAELRVQVSSYGTQIPRLFGTMRVAGTVFWATDLVERRDRQGSGKGRPGTTRYSYLANFAVLLSARPIRRVGRVWADGRLIRGQAGDWKVRTGFRVHRGGEDQAVDPLIASAEGQAPAVRGCAYLVFEGLELAEFGERIPSLTFEVVADEGPVRADAMVRELAPEMAADCALALEGFAAAGGSVAGVLDVLAKASGAIVGGLSMRDAPAGTVELADAGVSADGRGVRRGRALAPADTVPRVVMVAHYDPARDWQLGVQRAARPGVGGRTEAVEMPAALSADAAKALAGAMLARAEAGRVRRTVRLGTEGLGVRPGDGVRITGEAGLWRARSVEVERLAVTVELEPVAAEPTPVAASPGRVLASPDRVIGSTALDLFELPAMSGIGAGGLSGPRLSVAASGGAGWRGAALLYSLDGGASWVPAGTTAGPAVMGVVEVPPVPAGAALIDLVSEPVVRLPAHMALHDADGAALDAGANLALIGDELVQFGRAEPLGGGRWRLGRLLRGRYATEGAAAGTRFVLIEPDALAAIELGPEAIGRELRVLATGVGDGDGPAEALAVVTGRSVLPPAPVHLRVEELADGGARVTWVRRSRAGWRWIDGADAPLGEEREAWEVRVDRSDGSARGESLSSAVLTIAAAERAGAVAVSVRQRGDWGLGAAARVVAPAREGGEVE